MQKRKILIIAIGILLVFALNLFQGQVRGFFYSFSAPIQKTLWATGSNISDFFQGIFRKDVLITENKDFRLRNQELLAELGDLEKLKEENKALRKALGIGLADEFKLVFAAAIGKDAARDAILVDKGLADGLAEGMNVITEQRVLLGKVSEVYKNFARVILISDKESSFDAEILEKEIEGLIRGRGGQKIYLDLVPIDKAIEEGDVVVSSALGGIYPGGLLVGSITEVRKEDVKTFQQAEVAPFFKLKELRSVFIILE